MFFSTSTGPLKRGFIRGRLIGDRNRLIPLFRSRFLCSGPTDARPRAPSEPHHVSPFWSLARLTLSFQHPSCLIRCLDRSRCSISGPTPGDASMHDRPKASVLPINARRAISIA